MAYIVSARKYRPKSFDEVVGQRAVTTILQKAIEQKRLPQALLFTGPRGVGKTSCARIMAREVNRAYLDDPEQDLSFNIFELDAASNNSVDDIRELINQVNIPPQVGKYKVYIIDEVHMLSNQAFNAFLKTLEEPPEHAIFILATTEKHKILPTILSRCQVFDFKRISVKDIREHLRKIADAEGIDIEDEALDLIARKADGALRDALSAFDKIVNIGQGKITRKQVSEYLGLVDRDEFARMTGLFLDGDTAGVLVEFNRLADQGADIYHFIGGLASYLRDVMLMTDPRSAGLLDYPEQVKQALQQYAARTNAADLLRAVDILTQADLHYKTSQHPLLLTELSLLKVTAVLSGAEKKNAGNGQVLIPPQPAGKTLSESPKPGNTSTEQPEQSPKTQAESKSSGSAETKQDVEQNDAQNSGQSANIAEEAPPKDGILGLGTLKKLKKENGNKVQLHEPFTPEDLHNVWQEYLEYLSGKKEKNKYITLKEAGFEVEGDLIRLTFDSRLSQRTFNTFSDQLLQFLKKKLRNDHIGFESQVVERKREKKITYYTDAERLDRLKKLNPAVKDLIQKFKIRPV